MKRFFSLPFLLVLSVLISSAPLATFAQTPTVIVDPATVAPGGHFVAHASGFAPQSTVSITHNGQAFGVDINFNETLKATDTTGSVQFTGVASEIDRGTLSFDFTDEKGNATRASITVEGKALRPFLFSPQVEVTQDTIQVGITGVGWTAGATKNLAALDPEEQKYNPEFIDLCEDAACPERDDGLKLVVFLPRSTPDGAHTFIVSEQGGTDVRVTVAIPELPENQETKKQKASIFLVDPPTSTVDVISISVRGDGWGHYNDRRFARAWLIDPDTEEFYELKVDRNYRDCSFVKGEKLTGKCILETDEIFLRLEIPEALKQTLEPKKYLLYVKTEKNVEAGAAFTILAKPHLDTTADAAIAVIPNHGPVGTQTLLFGGSFPRKQIIDVRFDGVYTRLGGALWPNDDGTFDNIPLTIPRTITRDGKNITIEPGEHTITLTAGKVSAKTTFIVEGSPENKKNEEERKKKEEKERLEKEREKLEKEQEQLKKEQEKTKKEEDRLEKERKKLEEELKKKKEEEKREKDEEDKTRLEKERKKLEEELKKKKEQEKKKEEKIEDIKDRREEIANQFCDPTVPITFQPGCIPPKKTEDKKPSQQLYVPDSQGKPCLADTAITFQPGCIGQKLEDQKQLFTGKPCSADIPITFQPGCIPQVKPGDKPRVQLYVSDSKGKSCRADIAITFQPGCVSAEKPTETVKPFAGKSCDPNLPRVWQEGCIDKAEQAKNQKPQTQLYVPDSQGKPCRADIAITFQPGCVSAEKPTETVKPFAGKSCDPNLPRVWQEGCGDSSGKTAPVQQQTPTQVQSTVTITDKQAPVCNPLIPKYSQAGCVN